MREAVRGAIGEIIQDLVNVGLPATFTKKQLDEPKAKAVLDLQQEDLHTLDYRIQK